MSEWASQGRPMRLMPAAFSKFKEGEDLSLLDFKAIEYKRKGYAVATDEQLAKIVKVPRREFIRRRINQHTLEKLCRKEPVRAPKLAKLMKVLLQLESERDKSVDECN